MKIALASQNRRTLTAHAGKCRHFFVFDSHSTEPPVSVQLSPSQVLSVWSGEGPHPLAEMDVLVALTVGTGVAVKLAHRGCRVLATPERDLARVLEGLANDRLPVEPFRSEADARSQPGSCLPKPSPKPAAGGAMGAILGGNSWPSSL